MVLPGLDGYVSVIPGSLLLAAVKKRGKLADIDDGKRPNILVNKKGAR